jgi:carotenoid cleavage dioxygenase
MSTPNYAARRAVTPEDLPLTFRNVEPLSPSGQLPTGAPDWIYDVDHPYLHGLYAPVADEVDANDLVVEHGEIPADLCGLYVVNGPNQRFKPVNKYHYYDGDGMLHGIYFNEGRAAYKSRWIKTFAFNEENKAGESVWPGLCGPFRHDLPHSPIKDNSNTDILYYAGQLISLWYLAGTPYAIDPMSLDTRGPETFDGRLGHSLSAHSKVDPRTGELIFFNYQNKAPYMTYGVADNQGNMLFDTPIDLPGPRSPHDLAVTTHYSILHDLPYFQDAAIFAEHKRRVVRFHPDVPARFGVIPRHGRGDEIRWFEAEPCYMLHVVNAWEDEDEIVMVGCRLPNPGGQRDKSEGPLASQLAERRRVHQLHEWRFNLTTGRTRERMLDDTNTEFPTINRLFIGAPTRYAYHQFLPLVDPNGGVSGRCQSFDALLKYDLGDGSFQRYDYGARRCGGETHVAPRRGAGFDMDEDDGYLVTFMHDGNDWTSHCLIFDAKDIEQGPITKIRMPRRFHIGFHAMWVRGEDLGM